MKSRQKASLSRRRFVALAASGVAGAVVCKSGWGAEPSAAAGLELYTVGADLEKDPQGTLKKVAAIGYSEVEVSNLGKISASQWRDWIHEAGLRAPSALLPFAMEDTGKILEDAKALGVAYVGSSLFLPHMPQFSSRESALQTINTATRSLTEDDFKKMAAMANGFGEKAKAAGLQYVYHNHNFEFRVLGSGVRGYDILLRETDPSVVKFEADCGWMKVGGADPVALLTQHPERFALVHIKDFKNVTHPVTIFGAPDGPVPTELGRGSIDLLPIVKAARRIGVRHFYVEQEPPYKEMPPLEAAAVDYATLHSLLERA
ncbi:MAG: sugar phosphate isomerase/epimerase [Acidobacteriaceae bacterium]